MIQKQFELIDKSDIDALITNGVGESRTLEYKQTLPGSKDEDRKEFLADLSAFANSSGGDLLYGIAEKVGADGKRTGEPDSVTPLDINSDNTKLQLEDLIRQGIDPRVRVQVKTIEGWGPEGKWVVLLIRIPKSFSSPHMVTLRGTSKFFARSSAGKYQLDVSEIRSAVLATETQADRIKRFREDRLAKIIADQTPVPLASPHRLVLHMIPITSFLNREHLNLTADSRTRISFRPIGRNSWDHRINLDGFLTWSSDFQMKDKGDSYCQLFRDGTVEAVSTTLIRVRKDENSGRTQMTIPGGAYEHSVVSALSEYLQGYAVYEINGPIALSLALLGCRGAYMSAGGVFGGDDGHPIDRDEVILPDTVSENLSAGAANLLHPLFDLIWNACGFERSPNYDQTGKWNPR